VGVTITVAEGAGVGDVGAVVGAPGRGVGDWVCADEGLLVGEFVVGCWVGMPICEEVGADEGEALGAAVGDSVGRRARENATFVVVDVVRS